MQCGIKNVKGCCKNIVAHNIIILPGTTPDKFWDYSIGQEKVEILFIE